MSVQRETAVLDRMSWLARSALEFAVRCHGGRRRYSDGAQYIEHPLEVARLLREAGGSDVLVAAGLLHDVIEDGRVSDAELTARFGTDVAHLVRAVTDLEPEQPYRRRKHVLCEQVRGAGGDAALLFAADKIAKVRELPAHVRRDRARTGTADNPARIRFERCHRSRLAHYHESLGMLRDVVPSHPLVERLANELDTFETSVHA